MKEMIKRLLLLCILSTSVSAFGLPRVYHGHKVMSDDQFPFVVAIYYADEGDTSDLTAFCTGTLIGKSWVMTAAHCVINEDSIKKNPEDFYVGFGYKARTPKTANKIAKVKKIFTFDNKPVWPDFIQHDVALLQLAEPVNDIKPVTLPDSSQAFPDLKNNDNHATTVGYGFSDLHWSSECEADPNSDECSPDIITWEETLLYGNETIKPDSFIQDLLKKYMDLEHADSEGIIYNNLTMLGAISPDGTRGTNGDSGGPLLIQDAKNNEYTQIGITSWGMAPSYISYKEGYVTKEPAVFTNLTEPSILDFIHTVIKNNS